SGESGNDYSEGCANLRCENGSQCVKRRFWCRDPPCPGMLFCSKSRKELLKGPPTCDTVRCNKGHMCVIKVRGCNWDECKQQLARCVSEKEYYEGAASCAGFECPSGERCILRETYCVNPPCKLIRSCRNAEDVQTWFDKCKSLNCTSEYECFLRRPEGNCLDLWCTHTPDCTLTVEDELISKYCYGWMCPREQKCVVRILNSCKGFNCTIERSCRASSVSSAKRDANNEVVEQSPARRALVQTDRELERKTDTRTNYPIAGKKTTLPVTSTRRQNTRHTTPAKHRTEVSPTHRRIATTESNLIAEPLGSSTSKPYMTQLYPRSRLNNNKPSATDGDKVFQSSTSPATLFNDGKTESTMSRDMERPEAPREIYIATDALPLPMRDVNFLQGYPIWIRNDPYHTLKAKDEDGWSYHAPQEPYRILLPPYEPVIVVEDARRKFLPFFTDAFFTDLFNKATLMPLPEVAAADTGESKTDTSTIVDDKIANYTNNSKIIGTENTKTYHFHDSSNDHVNFPMTEKTNTASTSTRNKEMDNYYDDYEWKPWYVIHDYPERNEPQSSHERGSKSRIADLATDDLCKNDSDGVTLDRVMLKQNKRNVRK
ncbi:uncharacterized protein LOC105831204, partial [Monomorium pharaonis]|uniref:uncharacterized protein LOC105831204 n=1 Tax=Monomorium pharaonis TaxID=307658 RepID=UPI001747952D